ncbi:unnamed protein product, partial [Arabidopsis halleri]
KKKEERWFLENGSIFLKELIADCNGKSIPIRGFTSSQILKATKNFNSSCLVADDGFNCWYKGVIEDRSYMIKRLSVSEVNAINYRSLELYNDIILSARMSNHTNFLKLFGCCLEFRTPVLVFEYAEHGILNWRGRIMVNGEETILPWSVLLKIKKEIANAVTYLHMAFPKIIIHRDIKPTNILLGENWTAKLSDFSLSIVLPEGKSGIDMVVAGTIGYIDPERYYTDWVTEYNDVYSFGIFLMVILTGRPALIGSDGDSQHILSYVKGLYENGKLDEVIDPMMAKDITSGQILQVEACMVLALKCCEERDEDRPKMIQVAKELKRIE